MKFQKILIISFLLLSCSSCNNSSNFKTADKNIKDLFLNLYLYYEPTPGQDLSFPYSSYIDGDIFSTDSNKRLYTYEYESSFNKETSSIYFIYLKKSIYNKLSEINRTYIDSYLFYKYQNNIENKSDKDIKVLRLKDNNKINEVSFKMNNYLLVSSIKEYKYNIKNDLSIKENINKEIVRYFNNDIYFDDDFKISNIELNSTKNKYISLFDKTIINEEIEGTYHSSLTGLYKKLTDKIYKYDDKEVIVLPKYMSYRGENNIDILDENLNLDKYSNIDYYKDKKSIFNEAILDCATSLKDYNFSEDHYLFDLNILKNYMK